MFAGSAIIIVIIARVITRENALRGKLAFRRHVICVVVFSHPEKHVVYKNCNAPIEIDALTKYTCFHFLTEE